MDQKIKELNELKEKGLINEEQFREQKQIIIETAEKNIDVSLGGNDRSLWYYFKLCLIKNFGNFSARARRKEYWGFWLYSSIIQFLFKIVFLAFAILNQGENLNSIQLISFSIISLVYFIMNIYFIIPSISVLVRRLHDIGMSGWWILTLIVPLIAIFVKSDMEKNKYGDVPEGVKKQLL